MTNSLDNYSHTILNPVSELGWFRKDGWHGQWFREVDGGQQMVIDTDLKELYKYQLDWDWDAILKEKLK